MQQFPPPSLQALRILQAVTISGMISNISRLHSRLHVVKNATRHDVTFNEAHMKKFLFLFAVCSTLGLSWPLSWLSVQSENNAKANNAKANNAKANNTVYATYSPSYSSNKKNWVSTEIKTLQSQAANIDPNVLRLGLTAYLTAKNKGYAKKDLLTIIDYSKPSTQRRFWVFDLKSNRALFNTWVSHGKNSGLVTATSFSNSPGSLKSSIGVFLTDDTYSGKNGYSLRLRGLESVNSNAYARAVVIHGAAYAHPSVINGVGRMGRSWGCPALGSAVAAPIINTIKNRSLIFAYYPDKNWLSRSSFLTA